MASASSSCLFDPLDDLPFGVLSKIFLYIDLHDLFKSCTLVCKRWNTFLTGNPFWQDLVIAEFGSHNAAEFIKANKGNAYNLRNLLMTNNCFSPNCTSPTEIMTGDGGNNNEDNEETLESFLPKLATGSLQVNFDVDFHNACLINNRFFIFNLPALLKMETPICLDFYIRFYASVSMKFKAICLDKDFQPIVGSMATVHKDGFLVRYQAGTYFLVVEMSTPAELIRFVMPSHGRELVKFFRLMALTQGASNNDEHSNEVSSIIGNHRAIVNWSANGFTPLMSASFHGRKEIAEILLRFGAEVNRQIGESAKNTAISYAALQRKVEVVKLLLEHGADTNTKGFTLPLHFALFSWLPDFDLAKLLIEGGASVNGKMFLDKDKTLLMCAAINDNAEVAEFLMQHGADVNLRTSDGKSASDLCAADSATWKVLMNYSETK